MFIAVFATLRETVASRLKSIYFALYKCTYYYYYYYYYDWLPNLV